MRQIDSRRLAGIGVLIAAVVAACLVLPAVGRLSTLGGAWLAAAIMIVPTAAVLIATGYRYYGPGRSVAVAAAIMVIAFLATWVLTVVAVASALADSHVSLAMSVVLYAIPAALVAILGFLARKIVPGRSATEQPFERAGGG